MGKVGDVYARLGLQVATGQFNTASKAIRSIGYDAIFVSKQMHQTRASTIALGAALAALGAGATVAGIASIGKAVYKTATEFEQLRIRLKAVTKDSLVAKQGFDWIVKFAKETPLDLKETGDSFVKLTMRGIDATKSMQALADTVSVLGGGEQALTGITRALTQMSAKTKGIGQEFNLQLSQYLVDAPQLLNKHFGTAISTAEEAVERFGSGYNVAVALIDALGKEYAGGAALLMNTAAGQIEMLQDNFRVFADKVGQKGYLGGIRDAVKEINNAFDRLDANGKLDDLAQTFSIVLTGGIVVAINALGKFINLLVSGYRVIGTFTNSINILFKSLVVTKLQENNEELDALNKRIAKGISLVGENTKEYEAMNRALESNTRQIEENNKKIAEASMAGRDLVDENKFLEKVSLDVKNAVNEVNSVLKQYKSSVIEGAKANNEFNEEIVSGDKALLKYTNALAKETAEKKANLKVTQQAKDLQEKINKQIARANMKPVSSGIVKDLQASLRVSQGANALLSKDEYGNVVQSNKTNNSQKPLGVIEQLKEPESVLAIANAFGSNVGGAVGIGQNILDNNWGGAISSGIALMAENSPSMKEAMEKINKFVGKIFGILGDTLAPAIDIVATTLEAMEPVLKFIGKLLEKIVGFFLGSTSGGSQGLVPNTVPIFGIFHDGGIVGKDANSSSYGLKADEVPAILQSGEVVLSRDTLKNGVGSGGTTIVQNITVNGDVSPETVALVARSMKQAAKEGYDRVLNDVARGNGQIRKALVGG